MDDETTPAAFRNADAIMTAFAAAEMDILEGRENGTPIVLVPANHTFTLMPIDVGPLKESVPITFRIDGTLLASKDAFNYYHTKQEHHTTDPDILVFRDWTGFKVEGSGTVDGQGYMWWIREYLQTNPLHMKRPRLFNGYNLVDFEMSGIYVTNSPRFYIRCNDCDTVYIHDIEIYTDIFGILMIDDLFNPDSWQQHAIDLLPGQFSMRLPTFPLNTDGIDLYGRNVLIERVKITNFDDGVVVKPSCMDNKFDCSENIVVRDSEFWYTVGFSIGSVYPDDSYPCVRNVTFENSVFHHPIKSVYVKSNPGNTTSMIPGSGGLVEKIVYQNLTMHNAIWWNIYIGPQQ